MPSIPRGEDLARNIASGQSAITGYDTRAVGSGMAAAGDALSQAGTELQTKRINYQYAQAEAEFLTAKVELDNSFRQDDDYATIPDRYSSSLADAMGKASSLITDAAARENFTLQVQPRMAEGTARIEGVAWEKEKDYQRGYMDEKLAQAREAVIQGDVDAGVGVAEALIETGVDMGYFGHEEGVATLKAWQDDAVSAKIETMAPQDQLDALSQPWASDIPTDIRVRLERGAKDQLIQGTAQANVDGYLAKGYDREQALPEIRNITDAKTREATTRELDYQLSQQAAVKSEQQSELYNQYYLDVRSGRMRVADISFQDLYKMEPSIVENLYAAESRATAKGPAAPSDKDTLDNLYTLKALEDWDGLREFYQKNSAKLDPSDQDKWSEISANGLVPPETEAMLSMQDRIRNWSQDTFSRKNQSEEAARTVTNKFDQWFRQYQDANQKVPPDNVATDYFDFIVTEYNAGGYFSATKPLVLMGDVERGRVVQNIQRDDPAGYATVLDDLGIEDPNSELFLQAYQIYADDSN